MFIRNKNDGTTVTLQEFVANLFSKKLLNSEDVTVVTQGSTTKLLDTTGKSYLINRAKYDIYG